MSKKNSKRAKSEADAKTSVQLRRAIEDLISGRKKRQELEGTIIDATPLWMDWTIKEASGHSRPLFNDIAPPTTLLLGALVVAQGREIEKLTKDCQLGEQIRRHYPAELKSLESKPEDGVVDQAYAIIKTLPPVKRKPGRAYERKRLRYARLNQGLIEQEFGTVSDPLAVSHALAPLFSKPPPRCLDGIFQRKRVRMLYLMELFGFDRHRISNYLPDPNSPSDRRVSYDYRDFVIIMNALLREKPRKRRGRKRELWLGNPDLRVHVLSGIKERINSLSVPKDVRSEFLTLIQRHLPKSGKK